MNHNVYFWLKNDLTAEQITTFEAELCKLPKMGYITSGSVGKPAPTEERPVTDHSFSYTLTLSFKSMADHDFYQKDCPDHKHFVETCKPFFDRVIVYDSTPIE